MPSHFDIAHHDAGTTVSAEVVLQNVVWIVSQLDARGLAEMGDLPVLELAKHISIAERRAA